MIRNLIKNSARIFQLSECVTTGLKLLQRSQSRYYENSYAIHRKFITTNPSTKWSRSFRNDGLNFLPKGSQLIGNDFKATSQWKTRKNLHTAQCEDKMNALPSRSMNTCCLPLLMDPRGRVAVVTGGTVGIGLSIVESLLSAGAKVLIMDQGNTGGECVASRLANLYGCQNVQFVAGDVTCYEVFESCVSSALCKFSRLDILVNNAGILTGKPQDKIIDINYKALIFGTRLGLKYMGADQGKEGGVIINNASVVGMVGLPGTPVYSATKHAVIGATFSYGDSLTYEKTCVRVCAVCPGVTTTNMTTDIEQLPLDHFREGGGERTLLKDALGSMPPQGSEKLGPCVVHIVKHGPNGSIWVSEDSELYQVNIPDYHCIECCNSRVKLEC